MKFGILKQFDTGQVSFPLLIKGVYYWCVNKLYGWQFCRSSVQWRWRCHHQWGRVPGDQEIKRSQTALQKRLWWAEEFEGRGSVLSKTGGPVSTEAHQWQVSGSDSHFSLTDIKWYTCRLIIKYSWAKLIKLKKSSMTCGVWMHGFFSKTMHFYTGTYLIIPFWFNRVW